jgi:ornithine cyclodeaminase
VDLNLLSAAEIAERLPPTKAIDALEAALRGGLDPESDTPRSFVGVRNGELLLMPSEAAQHIAVKVLTVGGDPRIQGVVIVFDAETLAPVALLDGIGVTNVRTAAVSALAVKHLATEDAQRLLVFGRGPQSQAHVEAISAIRPIEHVDIVGREGAPDELVSSADIICCCTTSGTPVFDGSLVQDHATVVAIGSHDPDKRETDDALASRATVVVESRTSALREAGDVVAAIQSGALGEGEIITLAELVTGLRTPDPASPRLFKSSGMSWEDAVIAGALA